MRAKAAVVNPLAFLFLAVLLFSLGAPGQSLHRAEFAAGILWALVLLTNMLSLDGLFRRDFENGALEQTLIAADVPFVPVLMRVAVQWLSTGFIMTLLAPVLGGFLGLPVSALPTAMLALALGTPALSLLGAVGAALTVGFSRGGILLGLLVLPLYIPVLIFGSGAINQDIAGMANEAQLYWLIFISMLALTIAPFAVVAGLRISVQLQ
jgi:heme exporter protein B